MSVLSNRIKKVFQSTDADVILLYNTDVRDPNFLYLSDLRSGLFEGTFTVVKKDGMELLTNSLEYEIAKENAPKEMDVVSISSAAELWKRLGTAIKGKKVGMNYSFIPHSVYQRLSGLNWKGTTFVDSTAAFNSARAIKDDTEKKRLRRATQITKRAIDAGREALRVGITEEKAAAEIVWAMGELGAGTSFDSIVSFDANAALPHHMPDKTRLKENSIVLFDVGAKYMNYCGDVTRTFMFRPQKGSPKVKRFEEMYGVVYKAQRLALGMMKDGVMASKVHIAASDLIDSYGKGMYKGRFIHSLGHQIGIEVHDGSSGMSPGSKLTLKKDMVLSDEPGIYITGFGGVRIEDDVLVGKSSSSFF